jgi:DNA-binding transcriptional regulator YiaG
MIVKDGIPFNEVPIGELIVLIPVSDELNYQLATGALRLVVRLESPKAREVGWRMVRQVRHELNETQRVFGSRFGVSASAVPMWETDRVNIPFNVQEFIRGQVANRVDAKTP